ncbi:hypothetical protein GCK72_007685 [Caenorhabditis remanei]|uniref:C2H2-type domain-containing protein n=1 Tax=Caenorhabditis remanei TaxID=31234 RepID=A0A6A5HM18_CAERE|nr:hypothetical protein GCK72_007685 [Caenorhabditis remanei]KAF1767726.1 hypothetical protein GCK72_007685 [Caenorhabditis remanei]
MSASTKRFKCKVCREAFEFPYRLKLHSAVHSEERPFKCETCGKAFKRTYNLYEHMRIHKKNTGKNENTTIPVIENDEEEEEELDPAPEPKPQLQNIDSKKRKLASDSEKPLAKKVKAEDSRILRSQRNKRVDLDDSQSSSAHMKAVEEEPIEFENQSDETPKAMPLEDQNGPQSAMQPIPMSQNAVGCLDELEKAMDESVEKKNLAVMVNDDVEKEVKEEMYPVPEPKPQLQNINSNKRKLIGHLDKQLAKKVKTEDTTDHTRKLRSQRNKGVDLDDSQSSSAHMKAVKQEAIEFENQSDETPKAMPLEDQNQSLSAMHSTVSMSQNAVRIHKTLLPQQGFFKASPKTHFQNSNGTVSMNPVPVVQQQSPPNFDEDSRQISHQIMRVAANSTKDRQDCFRQLLFATVFAFESSPTCTNVEEFFRMMGERHAKK